MADTHLQINADGSTVKRKTVLWPSNTDERKNVLRLLFTRNNWELSRLDNISGSYWKVEVSCQDVSYKINLYIGSIRDEARQDDEFKMQLGNTYPTKDEAGWITLVLGIYTIADDNGNAVDYILSAYSSKKLDFSGNPSIRGTRTNGLKMASILGFYKTEKSYLFRPDFIYYYIKNQDLLNAKLPTLNIEEHEHNTSSYRHYLYALRTKPFMLLAGISGTGKSRIVRKLAQASVTEDLQRQYDPTSVEHGFNRWELHKPANFELIQVKPNWHNSLEVVGYKSNIGEAHYEFTPFVEFVARAWKHPKVPFFLCLDEMNLAPVEQYFAEFLSAIESRSIENGEYETDPIVKPFESFNTKNDDGITIDNLSDRMIAHLVGKLDTQRKSEIAERFRTKGLTLPPNLLVMGTVNMDETTFSFSRKVLDRAMSVVMNKVEYNKFFDGTSENDVAEMNDETKELLIDRPIRGLEAEDNEAEEVEKYLTNINTILEDSPFKLGYRAANEALLYVSAARKFTPNADLNTTLDEFTLMKILSRIEGDKRSIGGLLVDLQNVITSDYPQSNKKLIKMAETLKNKQFVSYWT